MSKEVKNIYISILIRPYKGYYIAICKEAGLIREAKTIEGAQKAIFSSLTTLLGEVQKDEKVIECFKVGLSFPMMIFFHWSIFRFHLLRLRKVVADTLLFQGSGNNILALPVHG